MHTAYIPLCCKKTVIQYLILYLRIVNIFLCIFLLFLIIILLTEMIVRCDKFYS